MRLSRTITALVLFVFGGSLFAWLLYDATSLQKALGLQAFLSEGAVAIGGLLVVAASLIGGLVLRRKGRGPAALVVDSAGSQEAK